MLAIRLLFSSFISEFLQGYKAPVEENPVGKIEDGKVS